jgi:hypothetical protein
MYSYQINQALCLMVPSIIVTDMKQNYFIMKSCFVKYWTEFVILLFYELLQNSVVKFSRQDFQNVFRLGNLKRYNYAEVNVYSCDSIEGVTSSNRRTKMYLIHNLIFTWSKNLALSIVLMLFSKISFELNWQ